MLAKARFSLLPNFADNGKFFVACIFLPYIPFQWRRDTNLFGKLIFSFDLIGGARHRKRFMNGI
ncbi:MAG: hypothetical protein A2156_16295 [Deltaproteobacteria bacterium RBG_16_48_10]|nr:MAG: hypothetical protein A2156_16295 [Deltaproteobacteria bacterium RBG_16_48_10]